jgi:hypothetical protein
MASTSMVTPSSTGLGDTQVRTSRTHEVCSAMMSLLAGMMMTGSPVRGTMQKRGRVRLIQVGL